MSDRPSPFGDRLRELRFREPDVLTDPLTRKELAKKSGLSFGTICCLEQGTRPNPRLSTLLRLASALKVTIDELVEGLKAGDDPKGDPIVEIDPAIPNPECDALIEKLVAESKKISLLWRDIRRLTGMWRVVDATEDGENPTKGKGATLAFEEDGQVRTSNGGQPLWGHIRLDPTTTPKRINLEFSFFKTNKSEGIYALDKDTLTLCFDRLGGQGRPEKFEVPEGSNRSLWKLERVKKQEAATAHRCGDR